jgi:hypothetical protein
MKEEKPTPEEFKKAITYFASLGGKATRQKYGKAHYSEIGKRGMASRWGKRKQTETEGNAKPLLGTNPLK